MRKYLSAGEVDDSEERTNHDSADQQAADDQNQAEAHVDHRLSAGTSLARVISSCQHLDATHHAANHCDEDENTEGLACDVTGGALKAAEPHHIRCSEETHDVADAGRGLDD